MSRGASSTRSARPAPTPPAPDLTAWPGAATLAARVVRWQRVHGRHDLPWQATQQAYHRWLSEVMLQQTQVSTVRGYYDRFLQRFPTVADLAAAPADELMALWAGLGYYARARNLHACAQAVVARHGGEFPRSAAQLAELPGIGRSTAAAIASFCFDERVAILDGNVKRVLSRALGFDEDLASAAAEKRLWAIAEALLPTPADGLGEGAMAAWTQGIMDLGATVCSVRKPACDACPLRDTCAGRASGQPEALPVKTKKLKRGQRRSALLWLTHGDAVYLLQRPATGVWAQLWTLPMWDELAELEAAVADWPGGMEIGAPFLHVLTHLDWTLQPVRLALPEGALPAVVAAGLAALDAQAREAGGVGGGRWVTASELAGVGLPAPVRRLLDAG